MRHAADVTWYPLLACDESFFAHNAVRLPVSGRASRSRGAGVGVADLGPAVGGVGRAADPAGRWTSPRPLGLGATREIELSGNSFALREYYFRWDEGRRYSFYGTECNRSVLRRFAEDYVVESTGRGSRFTWTIAFEPTDRWRWLIRGTAPLNALAFRVVPIRAKAYFTRHPTA